MKTWGLAFLLLIVGGVASSLGTWWWLQQHPDFFVKPNPLQQVIPIELPLNQYRITELRQRTYQPSPIAVERVLKVNDTYTSYVFSFTTLGKKMSGQLNVPNSAAVANLVEGFPVIVLFRGYVPPEQYHIGAGTERPAEFFAEHGYVTLAPDFFGYGESDPESNEVWETRFQKPLNAVELIKSIQQTKELTLPNETVVGVQPKKLGVWAHSNGGQVALTTLEILGEPIPTTLWAPVTAPFPYSVLYFSDEEADEGKASRAWIAEFERNYDVFAFSLTQHLDLLTGPLQIQQGLQDDAIHYTWSEEFVAKLKEENLRRSELSSATTSAQLTPPIDVTFFTYPDANHNMQPAWSTAIQRDATFFEKNLK